jgi:hypothetical protein
MPNASLQQLPEAPGSQGMLPGPSPLRTVPESLPSHGSSPYCLLAMSLVVRMMPPPMHKHAVFLAIIPTRVFGGDVVIVAWIAVVERHLAESTPIVLALQEVLALWGDGQGLLAPLLPLSPVCLQGRVHRRRLPADLGVSGDRDVLMPQHVRLGFRADILAVSDGTEVPLADPLR